MHTAEYWIKKLNLQKHPEGGFFKEVYRAEEIIPKYSLHERYSGDRNHATSIYFLITSNEFSAFHRIKSDETWHFYYGSSITLHMINDEGMYSTVKLGSNSNNGGVFQFTVPHGVWFAASVDEAELFALLGCTVAPGFHFDDFELGKREVLIELSPKQEAVIRKFTRG